MMQGGAAGGGAEEGRDEGPASQNGEALPMPSSSAVLIAQEVEESPLPFALVIAAPVSYPRRRFGSWGTHGCNVLVLAVSVLCTTLIYLARISAAKRSPLGNSTGHLRWRCPLGTFAAVVFAGGQLSGVGAMFLTSLKNLPSSVSRHVLFGFGLRHREDPPARGFLGFYLCVSGFSAAMLLVVLLWVAGVPSPRCLSGSALCLALRKNLDQTSGWVTAALGGLAVCQLMGTFAASRSLRVCGCWCGGPPDAAGAGAAAAAVRSHPCVLPVGVRVGVASVAPVASVASPSTSNS